MKNIRINIGSILLVLIVAALTFFACKEEEVYPRTRLFRPVLNEDLYSLENTIVVDMGKLKEAVSYTLEVSRDTFKTIDYTINTDTTFVVIDQSLVGEELLWFTIYQVRATAHADDPEYDSKISELGNVRTQKYPSNQGAPTFFDVTDKRARVFWVEAGLPITGVKVFAINDLRLENPLLEFEVTDQERLDLEKIVTGLSPETEYQIAIYSGENQEILRGWEIYTTKPALVSGDNVVDLTGIDDPDILVDTLPNVGNGSIILLEGGKTYNAGGHNFDKSVLVMSGYSFTPALPLIDCSSNFNMVDNASVDSIVFKDLAFKGDIGGNYVFNISRTSTLNKLKFDGCEIHSLRGMLRMKGGDFGELTNYIINDCVIDSIGGYGIMTVDRELWIVRNVSITNSTFSKVELFLRNRKGTDDFTSITIEGCTMNEIPKVGQPIFRNDNGVNVTDGIKIHNTIWGPGWNKDGADVPAVKGTSGFDGTNFDIVNVWATSDFSFASDEIPGFPSSAYSGTSEDLWVDPYFGMDFNIEDSGFPGKNSSGDPRWRPGI